MTGPTQEAPATQPRTWASVGMVASLVLLLASVAGCMFFNGGDIARSNIPVRAQEQLGLPAETSHNKAIAAYEQWVAETRLLDEQWTRSLNVSGPKAQRWNDFGLGLAAQAEGILLPWLGSAGLGGIGTLIFAFLRGQKREEIAYNQGREETLETASRAASEARFSAQIGAAAATEAVRKASTPSQGDFQTPHTT